jgi:hypothetical protein
MPRRPKLYIHRTRRFWVGLGVLLALGVVAIGSGSFTSGFKVKNESIRTTGGSPTVHGWRLELGTIEGCITASWIQWDVNHSHHLAAPGWEWDGFFRRFPTGHRLLPTIEKDPWFDEHTLFLPLWPLPVLWAIIWITRMVRAERRELKRFSDPAP